MGGKPAGKVQLVQTMLGSTVFCVGIENLDGKRKVAKVQSDKVERHHQLSKIFFLGSNFCSVVSSQKSPTPGPILLSKRLNF
jgi:hypothetical protein